MRAFLLAPVLALLFPFAVTAGEDPSTVGSAVRGATVFRSVGCVSCHGTRGGGGGRAGPRIAPNPLPYRAILAIVRRPASQRMPVYSERVLTDRDVRDIHAYLDGIPSGPPASAIPLLNR